MTGTRGTHSLGAACCAGALALVALAALALVACGGSGAAGGSAATPPKSASPAGVASPQTAAPGTIAFTRVMGSSAEGGDVLLRTDICTVRSDGTGLTRLTRSGDCSSPAWSPDGRRLACIRLQPTFPTGAGVWTMDADGSARRYVVRGMEVLGPGLAWSPGARIAFSIVKGEDKVVLFAVDPESRWAGRVTPRVAPATVDTHPAWAPDGALYFIRSTSDKVPAGICSIAGRGERPTVVQQAPLPATFSLSPGGRWLLLWDRTRDALVRLPSGGGGEEVVVLDRVSRYVGRTLAVSTSWSPDGSRIAFAAGMWPPSALYTMAADGSGVSKVPGVGDAFDPAWRPE